MAARAREYKVVVWGDVIVNWVTYQMNSASTTAGGVDRHACAVGHGEYGGAVLVYRLLRHLPGMKLKVLGQRPRPQQVELLDEYWHSYAVAKLHDDSKHREARELEAYDAEFKDPVIVKQGNLRGIPYLEASVEEGSVAKAMTKLTQEKLERLTPRIDTFIGREFRPQQKREGEKDRAYKRKLGRIGLSLQDDPGGISKNPDLIVIVDHNLNRGREIRETNYNPDDDPTNIRSKNFKLPPCIESPSKSAPWVIYRLSEPLENNKLLEHLIEIFGKKLIVVLPSDAVRASSIYLSSRFSWEQMAEDVLWGLNNNCYARELKKAGHLIVPFETGGAFHYDGNNAVNSSLIYDNQGLEGFWLDRFSGTMMGPDYCLLASLSATVLEVGERLDTESLRDAITIGLHARRDMQLYGFEQLSDLKGAKKKYNENAYGWPVHYLANRIAKRRAKLKEDRKIAKDILKEALANAGKLSKRRKEAIHREHEYTDSIFRIWPFCGKNPYRSFAHAIRDNKCEGPLRLLNETLDRCESVVKEGPSRLKRTPLGKFDELISADRSETENFRAIRRLIIEYAAHADTVRGRGNLPKPLSVAVFGPPGSGKSFAVTKIAVDALKEKEPQEPKFLNFNLSQFLGPEDLVPAFNTIRDVSIKGQMPIVFWDEFDSALATQPLAWLKYFLAPMQDGEFSDRGTIRPIGRCVFVFAGGVYPTRQHFEEMLATNSEGITKETAEARKTAFKAAKGPDFLSRLKGYINIRGLSNIKGPDLEGEKKPAVAEHVPESEIEYRCAGMTRRALLLHHTCSNYKNLFFERRGEGKPVRTLNIDEHLLRAFLLLQEYKHQARSLESIVNMCVLTDKHKYERSSVPSREQLELHLNDGAELSQAMLFDVWYHNHWLTKDNNLDDDCQLVVKFLRMLLENSEFCIDSKKYLGGNVTECLDDLKEKVDERLVKMYADFNEQLNSCGLGRQVHAPILTPEQYQEVLVSLNDNGLSVFRRATSPDDNKEEEEK